MPVYEFSCLKCNKLFEIVRPIARFDSKKVKCPSCGSRSVERRWTERVRRHLEEELKPVVSVQACPPPGEPLDGRC